MKPLDEKTIRLVMEDKVSIRWRSPTLNDGVPDAAQGVVEGDHGVYKVSYSPSGRVCECPASVDCSHSRALELAVLREADERLSNAQ